MDGTDKPTCDLKDDEIAQLKLLVKPTWDGDLISKAARDGLYRKGYVGRTRGFNFLKERGIAWCVENKVLTS